MRLLVISSLIVSTSAFFLTQPSALPNPQPSNGQSPPGGMKSMPGADMNVVMQMVKQILTILLPKLMANPQLMSTFMGGKPPAGQMPGLMGFPNPFMAAMAPQTTAAPPAATAPPAQHSQPGAAQGPQPPVPAPAPAVLPPFGHHHHHHQQQQPNPQQQPQPAAPKPMPFMPPSPPINMGPRPGPPPMNPLMTYAAAAANAASRPPSPPVRPPAAVGGVPGRGMGYIPTNDAHKDMQIIELLNDPRIGFANDPRLAGLIPPAGSMFGLSIGDKVKDYIQYKLMARQRTRPLTADENRLLFMMGDPPKEFFMGGFGSRMGGLAGPPL